MLHLQGFDDDLQEMLQRQEPVCRQVIPRLTAGAIGVLQEVLGAFPNEPEMSSHHLLKFAQAVKDLNRSVSMALVYAHMPVMWHAGISHPSMRLNLCYWLQL